MKSGSSIKKVLPVCLSSLMAFYSFVPEQVHAAAPPSNTSPIEYTDNSYMVFNTLPPASVMAFMDKVVAFDSSIAAAMTGNKFYIVTQGETPKQLINRLNTNNVVGDELVQIHDVAAWCQLPSERNIPGGNELSGLLGCNLGNGVSMTGAAENNTRVYMEGPCPGGGGGGGGGRPSGTQAEGTSGMAGGMCGGGGGGASNAAVNSAMQSAGGGGSGGVGSLFGGAGNSLCNSTSGDSGNVQYVNLGSKQGQYMEGDKPNLWQNVKSSAAALFGGLVGRGDQKTELRGMLDSKGAPKEMYKYNDRFEVVWACNGGTCDRSSCASDGNSCTNNPQGVENDVTHSPKTPVATADVPVYKKTDSTPNPNDTSPSSDPQVAALQNFLNLMVASSGYKNADSKNPFTPANSGAIRTADDANPNVNWPPILQAFLMRYIPKTNAFAKMGYAVDYGPMNESGGMSIDPCNGNMTGYRFGPDSINPQQSTCARSGAGGGDNPDGGSGMGGCMGGMPSIPFASKLLPNLFPKTYKVGIGSGPKPAAQEPVLTPAGSMTITAVKAANTMINSAITTKVSAPASGITSTPTLSINKATQTAIQSAVKTSITAPLTSSVSAKVTTGSTPQAQVPSNQQQNTASPQPGKKP